MKTMNEILALIEERGGQRFSAHEIATELRLCRQTVYKHIRKLNELGYRIDGEAGYGFIARPLRKAA